MPVRADLISARSSTFLTIAVNFLTTITTQANFLMARMSLLDFLLSREITIKSGPFKLKWSINPQNRPFPDKEVDRLLPEVEKSIRNSKLYSKQIKQSLRSLITLTQEEDPSAEGQQTEFDLTFPGDFGLVKVVVDPSLPGYFYLVNLQKSLDEQKETFVKDPPFPMSRSDASRLTFKIGNFPNFAQNPLSTYALLPIVLDHKTLNLYRFICDSESRWLFLDDDLPVSEASTRFASAYPKTCKHFLVWRDAAWQNLQKARTIFQSCPRRLARILTAGQENYGKIKISGDDIIPQILYVFDPIGQSDLSDSDEDLVQMPGPRPSVGSVIANQRFLFAETPLSENESYIFWDGDGILNPTGLFDWSGPVLELEIRKIPFAFHFAFGSWGVPISADIKDIVEGTSFTSLLSSGETCSVLDVKGMIRRTANLEDSCEFELQFDGQVLADETLLYELPNRPDETGLIYQVLPEPVQPQRQIKGSKSAPSRGGNRRRARTVSSAPVRPILPESAAPARETSDENIAGRYQTPDPGCEDQTPDDGENVVETTLNEVEPEPDGEERPIILEVGEREAVLHKAHGETEAISLADDPDIPTLRVLVGEALDETPEPIMFVFRGRVVGDTMRIARLDAGTRINVLVSRETNLNILSHAHSSATLRQSTRICVRRERTLNDEV
jgi:hypothetical protein